MAGKVQLLNPEEQPTEKLYHDLLDYRSVRGALTAPRRFFGTLSQGTIAQVQGNIDVIEGEIQKRAERN